MSILEWTKNGGVDALNYTFYETRFTVIYKCNKRDNNNHNFSSLGPIW